MPDQPRGPIGYARQQQAARATHNQETATPHPTPRERLTRAGLSAQFVDLVLAEHAHQLAEQIRADAQARHDRSYSDNRVFELKGSRNSADLIDPEAGPR